jgi:hypothetical protein
MSREPPTTPMGWAAGVRGGVGEIVTGGVRVGCGPVVATSVGGGETAQAAVARPCMSIAPSIGIVTMANPMDQMASRPGGPC